MVTSSHLPEQEGQRLPTDHPLPAAALIYVMRLGLVLLVAAANILPFGLIILLNRLGVGAADSVWLLLLAVAVVVGLLVGYRRPIALITRLTDVIDNVRFSDRDYRWRLLRATRSFAGLNHAQLKLIASHTHLRTFAMNELIFREGEPGVNLFIIVQGKVLVYREQETSTFELKAFGDGEFFGEMALLDENPRSANARAISNTTVLVLDRRSFLEAVRIDPAIAIFIMRELSLRARDFNTYAEQLAGRYSETERFALRLLGLAAQIGEFEGAMVRIRLEYVRGVIGQETTNEALAARLSEIEAEGDIIVESDYLILRDFYGLFRKLFSDIEGTAVAA